ncbi:MAG: DUF4125 family protein, partial [Firmicutes bacterium]|nr:DUF4125 family protein [Bacillota bacterium]
MEKKDIIQSIVEKEWPMFHNVNGEDRVDCQEDPTTFYNMRTAQFKVWDEASLESYDRDLDAAIAAGRSLVKEKYIWMMQNTDKEAFEAFRAELPEVSAEKEALVKDIWTIMLAQTEELRKTYPLLALGGRPLHAAEEDKWASIETYQTSELKTYSEDTLKKLLAHIKDMQAKGEDFVYKIQENSVTCLGYKDMKEAEIAMMGQVMNDFGISI